MAKSGDELVAQRSFIVGLQRSMRRARRIALRARLQAIMAGAVAVCLWASPARGQSNGVLREVFFNIGGSSLQRLTNDSSFPNSPSVSEIITSAFEGPRNYGDNFGDRYRAILVPPATGSYIFWVEGDDAAALFLSPDESPNNKVQIAYNTNTAIYRMWYTYASQESSNVFLQAGKRYYVEAIHSAGTGDDAISIGWKLPDGTLEQPIPAARLWVYGLPATTKPVITAQPTNLVVLENATATFWVSVSNYDAVTYQWVRSSTILSGARGASIGFAVTTNDNGASFACIVSNSFGAVTSVTAVLTVTPDSVAPVLMAVANLDSNLVQVCFSEPVDPATGTNAANYGLNNGATVSSAAAGASAQIVLLTTSVLQRGTNYTLTVNNVRDAAAARNSLAVNSQQGFTALLKGVYREVFADIPGTLVLDLTNSAVFPNSPSSAEVLSGNLETGKYSANNYGQRLRAAIIPPLTGNYTFWLSAHETASLLLGTNSAPSGARQIASVTADADVSARQWAVQTNQVSTAVSLIAGQQYYIEVLSKGGVTAEMPPDHLSVRWQWPNGAYEEPIPISRLTPVGLNLPAFIRQPASTNVAEGSDVVFSAAVSDLEPVFFQWQRNGTNVPGATNASYTNSSVTLANNGFSFRCLVSNALGTTNSSNATLVVTADTIRPTITSVVNNGSNRVVVTFSEAVDPTTATAANNYLIPSLTISAPALSANGRSVTLTTTPLMSIGSAYTITVNRVRDRAAAYNVIATNSQFTFTTADFFLQDIGTPLSGTAVPAGNGINMIAGNGDFGGTNDSFNYLYEQRRGDFDVKVRVARLDMADVWTSAALMVRGDLGTNSAYAAVVTTPSIAGTFFQYRATTGALPQKSGSFPANIPYTWLRLQRTSGTTFNGFASFDGQTWTKLGSVNLSVSSTIYLGFIVSSHNSNAMVSAQFRDFGDTTSTNIGPVNASIEPVGPSSRRTGLAFTEIMYHPAPRTDGRSLEFVELFNSNPFWEDLSGCRISGDISYTFPEGTILQGGSFLVVARVPADIQAIYGISSVMGPYTNNLSNKSGSVRLRNRGNAVLLEVNYDSGFPWPLAPDGTGHSLVLAKPSWGEGNAQAWAQSDQIGGSPGSMDGLGSESIRNVVINEFLAHTDLPDVDYIELYNHGTNGVDISGCWLSDDPSTNKFRIPNGTTIGTTGFVFFTEATLGFALSASGESLYFVNSNRTRVIDAVSFDAQENGVSMGRSPDGAAMLSRLATKTPGAPNGLQRSRNLVINEIMYHPVSEDNNDTYVEIYNRGTSTNLTGWRLNAGIDFDFPSNTIIASNGYLVIAENVTNLIAHYPGQLTTTNTIGNFKGSLAHSGERIALEMPDTIISTNTGGKVTTNVIHIPVDEVTYGKGGGGKWGNWSDGGGSSMELIDPRSDSRLPSNWADSDDTAKSAWVTNTVTGTLDYAPGSDSKNNSLQVYLLDAGECLLDDFSVSINGSGNLVTNAGFESGGLTNWSFQGTHRTCRLENAGAPGSSHSLHVVGTGRGDPGPNKIYTILNQSYTTGVVGTITAKMKWLHGKPEILLRLRNNPLDLPAFLNIPKNLGTPGAKNSRYVTNAGPAITETIHSPVLPEAGEAVVVTARVHDPDSLASVQLSYRVDPFGSTTTVPMNDSGTNGDAVAGDGIYAGTIPGQAAGTLVAFYVQATDGGSPAATARIPSDAPTNECLVRFGEEQLISAYGTYRFWLTQNNYNNWVLHEKLSNEPNPGTFVYGNFRVIYNAGDRFGGSPFHQDLLDTPLGTNCDYYVTLPTDDRLMGADSMTFQTPGNFGRDLTDQNEQTAYWMARELKAPYLYRRSINVYLNGTHRGRIYEDTQQPDGDFNAEFFTDDGDGDLYKVQYDFEFTDATDNSSTTPASLQKFLTTGGVKKLARYRQTFTKRAINDSPHNYTNLFNLVDTLSTSLVGDGYINLVSRAIDLREWMDMFALERMLNNSDLYGNQKQSGNPGGQNCYIYKPLDDGWKFLAWDIDFCFSGSPTEYMFNFTDPPISNLCAQPFVLRLYYQALEDLANGPLAPAKAFPLIDSRYAAFQADGIDSVAPDSMKNFIRVRHDYILQLVSEVRAGFSITGNGANNFTNPSTLATLTGTAPLTVHEILINGIEYPLSWATITNWSVQLPLGGRTNQFVVQAFDGAGNLLSNLTRTVTIYFNGTIARAEDSLVINEIMFQPAVTNAHYVEIYNRSTNTTFDLHNYRLEGVDFDFVPGNIIAPQSYLVVVKNIDVFQSAYGTNAQIAGEYQGDLDRDGETLTLVRLAQSTNETDTVITKSKYEIVPPWPVAPAVTNSGVALQVIDPSQDTARVSNWDEASNWRFFSYTAKPTSSTMVISIWLSATNELFLDDVRFVLGSVPGAGSNYLRNGNFETNPIGPWTFSGGYQGNSGINALFAKTGTNSLRLAPLIVGSSSAALTQAVASVSTSSNYTLSFWYRPAAKQTTLTVRLGTISVQTNFEASSTNRATPGLANSVAAAVNPYPLLWINEVQPNNLSTLLDNTGTPQPWIELFNSGTNIVPLDGLSLSKSYTNLNMWSFPAGSFLLPGQFRVIFVDGRPQFSSGSVLHAAFTLDPTNGSIVLSRTNQILDYINYSGLRPDQSYGDSPDGQLFTRQTFFFVTPGASNNAAPVPVVLNEWMADNTRTLTNQLTGKADDWFELYNIFSQPVDLSGFYLTDDKDNKNKWRIPDGTVIGPNGFLLGWADGTTGTNTTGNALHTSFKLSKSGSFLGLYSPTLLLVDKVTFAAQTSDVSQGRYLDGNFAGPLYSMPSATPRTNNVISTNAFAPVLTAPGGFTVNEGMLLTFTNHATDADLPAQPLTFSLAPGAPEGAQMDPNTGVFTWQTVEIHGPGVYPITIVVSDNSAPALTDSKVFQVTVNESNTPPSISPIADVTTYAGTLVSVPVVAADADLPAQSLAYILLSSPAGASVDASGNFTWTPSAGAAGTTNLILVKVSDNGTPSLSATQTFRVIVSLGSPCLGLKGDVFPRGAPNDSIGITTDWVQMGRFVAGLNTTTSACEFARADCAPKPCGNGLLGVTDWVQVGRYAAGLDGPVPQVMDCPPSGGSGTTNLGTNASARTLSFTNTTIARGTTNCFAIILNSQGNENAFGFSFQFDTNVLTYVSAARGPDALSLAQFILNTNDLPQGRLGIAMILSPESVFPAGLLSIASVCFSAAAGSNTVTRPLTFTDLPVGREGSDALANPVAVTYNNGNALVQFHDEFLFMSLARQTSGAINLKMTGTAGTWEIQSSSNFLDWRHLWTLTNPGGPLEYYDTDATNSPRRFYKAVRQ